MVPVEMRTLLWLVALFCCCVMAVGVEEVVLKIVEAPIERESEADGYEKYEQGSTAWACTDFEDEEPQLGYSALESYLNGGNVEDQQMMEGVVLYPLQEIYSSDAAVSSSICIYLQKQDHCYPPKPADADKIEIRKQFDPINYFAIRYWGQSSTPRTEHYRDQLKTALGDASEEFDEDHYTLSYFPNHVREVRFDEAAAEEGDAALECPDNYEDRGADLGCMRIIINSGDLSYLQTSCTGAGGYVFEPLTSTSLQSLYEILATDAPNQEFFVGAKASAGNVMWATNGAVSAGDWRTSNDGLPTGTSLPGDCVVIERERSSTIAGYLSRSSCYLGQGVICLHEGV